MRGGNDFWDTITIVEGIYHIIIIILYLMISIGLVLANWFAVYGFPFLSIIAINASPVAAAGAGRAVLH